MNESTAIDTSDKVILASGGPLMELRHRYTLDGTEVAECCWIEGNKEQSATFPVAALRKLIRLDECNDPSSKSASQQEPTK